MTFLTECIQFNSIQYK